MDRSDNASFCSVRRGRRAHGTSRNFMHENRETSETPAVQPDGRSAGEGLGHTARMHVTEESHCGIVRAEQHAVREGQSPSGAQMRGAISKSGGNASLAEGGRRYADVQTGTKAKAGYSQDGAGATASSTSEGRVSTARWNPKGMRRSTGP
jgi:hypothetical protein